MKVSNCCGVRGDNKLFGKLTTYEEREKTLDRGETYEDHEICHKCGEHCVYVEETKESLTIKNNSNE